MAGLQTQGPANFVLKSQVVSVTTAQLCLWGPEAATDTVGMKGCGCVSIKLYLHKQVVDWPAGCGRPLLIPPPGDHSSAFPLPAFPCVSGPNPRFLHSLCLDGTCSCPQLSQEGESLVLPWEAVWLTPAQCSAEVPSLEKGNAFCLWQYDIKPSPHLISTVTSHGTCRKCSEYGDSFCIQCSTL